MVQSLFYFELKIYVLINSETALCYSSDGAFLRFSNTFGIERISIEQKIIHKERLFLNCGNNRSVLICFLFILFPHFSRHG